MKRGFLLTPFLVLLLVAVWLWTNAPPHATHSINPLRGTELRLPRVGTVGQEPPAGARVLISVTEAGYVRVGRDPTNLSFNELRDLLEKRVDIPALREPDGSSRLAVLFDIDETIPWIAVQWLMQTCAHPAIKLYRLYFAARSLEGGIAGALATRLPKDRWGPVGQGEGPPRFRVKAFHREHAPSDPRALYAALLETPLAKRKAALWELAALPPHGGKVPYGYMLRVLDAMLAAGASAIMFEGAAGPVPGDLFESAEAMAAYLGAKKAAPGASYLKLGTHLLTEDAPLKEIPRLGRIERVLGFPAAGEEVAWDTEIWIEEPVLRDDSAAPLFGRRGETPLASDGGARRRQAAESALAWLAAHQRTDGGWSAHSPSGGKGEGDAAYDVWVTGLALCAFLAAGHRHRGAGPYTRVVSKGLRYLKTIQDPDGCFGPRTAREYGYNHAAAALAMVEAYGMTGSPIFKGSAARALSFIALSRNPDLAWGYGIKPGDNNTSLSAWMLMPLVSARLINANARKHGKQAPLPIDEACFVGMEVWLRRRTDKATGRITYALPQPLPKRAGSLAQPFPFVDGPRPLTAAAALCRVLSGVDPRKDPLLKLSLASLAEVLPRWGQGTQTYTIDMAYWYWGSLAAFQAGGSPWIAWQRALDTAILDRQHAEGGHAALQGSWDPVGAWGAQGGRVYATAILCLVCQTAERYTRIHK